MEFWPVLRYGARNMIASFVQYLPLGTISCVQTNKCRPSSSRTLVGASSSSDWKDFFHFQNNRIPSLSVAEAVMAIENIRRQRHRARVGVDIRDLFCHCQLISRFLSTPRSSRQRSRRWKSRSMTIRCQPFSASLNCVGVFLPGSDAYQLFCHRHLHDDYQHSISIYDLYHRESSASEAHELHESQQKIV